MTGEEVLKDDPRAVSLKRELKAMREVAGVLEELPGEEQDRVVDWMWAKYARKDQ